MSAALFDMPARPIETTGTTEARITDRASRSIQWVADMYSLDGQRASNAGLHDVALHFQWVRRELERAAKIARTGFAPGDGAGDWDERVGAVPVWGDDS